MAIQSHLRLFFITQYLCLLGLLLPFLDRIEGDSPLVWGFVIAALLTYPLFYLLPALLITGLAGAVLLHGRTPAAWRRKTMHALAFTAGTLTLIVIYADYQLYQLYEYHFNAFVWNLITTDGGIQSLGATNETRMTYGLMIAGLVFGNACLWLLSHRLTHHRPLWSIPRRHFALGVALLFALLATEEISYAYNHFMRKESIPLAATMFPFHLETTSKSFFHRLGFEKPAENEIRIANGKIHYPLAPIAQNRPEKPLNVVWLVAESLRWDMLNARTMPNLNAFSEQSLRFNHHYSGGNRTRMGMFSMFYGLYAPYWYAFQEQKVGPVLVDTLLKQDYQMAIHTSQSFSYPELKDTVFADVPKDRLHELSDGAPSWQRDEQNISQIIDFIDHRTPDKPFFSFMFFEATHAPYDFSPEQDRVKTPYLENLNYARISAAGNIDLIKNRYINAAHSVDRQVGRLLKYLEEQQLLDNTIVLFTGDHGEEFMEEGHWGHGHNAAFPEHQIHVPLVLHIPGQGARKIDDMTSHLEIPATLAPYLGIETPTSEWTFSSNLLQPESDRFVAGNYNYAALIDDDYKIIFPFRDTGFFRFKVVNAHDLPVSREEKAMVMEQYKEPLERFSAETEKFILN